MKGKHIQHHLHKKKQKINIKTPLLLETPSPPQLVKFTPTPKNKAIFHISIQKSFIFLFLYLVNQLYVLYTLLRINRVGIYVVKNK